MDGVSTTLHDDLMETWGFCARRVKVCVGLVITGNDQRNRQRQKEHNTQRQIEKKNLERMNIRHRCKDGFPGGEPRREGFVVAFSVERSSFQNIQGNRHPQHHSVLLKWSPISQVSFMLTRLALCDKVEPVY